MDEHTPATPHISALLKMPSLPPTLTPLILPPALQAELGSIVDLLIIETVFPTLLVPVAVFLFASTTSEVRRKPVFVLNIVAILLGLIFGGVAIACLVSTSVTQRSTTE